MFDENILYYAYDNLEGDDFGVGYLDDKSTWVNRINSWGKQDGTRHDFTTATWDKVFPDNPRGCLLAEVVPDEQTYLVTWMADKSENSIRIDYKGDFLWENNPTKSSSIPRWMYRLKRNIKERNIQ